MSQDMPDPIRTARRADVGPRIAASTAIAAHWLLSVTVIAANSQWNPLTRQLSEYALGHHGWLQDAAFFATALAYGCLAVAVRDRVRGLAGRIGLGILAVCAVGSVGVGVFVTDPMTTPPDALTTHGVLHVISGAGALLLLPAAALLITRSLARAHPAGSRAQTILRGVALLPLAGLLLIWVPEVAGLIPTGGWPDRVLFLTYTVWVVMLAGHPAAVTSFSDRSGSACSQ
jgi:hypothetical protein